MSRSSPRVHVSAPARPCVGGGDSPAAAGADGGAWSAAVEGIAAAPVDGGAGAASPSPARENQIGKRGRSETPRDSPSARTCGGATSGGGEGATGTKRPRAEGGAPVHAG